MVLPATTPTLNIEHAFSLKRKQWIIRLTFLYNQKKNNNNNFNFLTKTGWFYLYEKFDESCDQKVYQQQQKKRKKNCTYKAF